MRIRFRRSKKLPNKGCTIHVSTVVREQKVICCLHFRAVGRSAGGLVQGLDDSLVFYFVLDTVL
jgi:hypothetical protein